MSEPGGQQRKWVLFVIQASLPLGCDQRAKGACRRPGELGRGNPDDLMTCDSGCFSLSGPFTSNCRSRAEGSHWSPLSSEHVLCTRHWARHTGDGGVQGQTPALRVIIGW